MAALLGHGDVGMTGLRHTQPKIDHQRLVYIGTRSFETEERALLDHLGATIYDMPTIEDKGLATCIHEALNLIGAEHKPFGISLDLDVFDLSTPLALAAGNQTAYHHRHYWMLGPKRCAQTCWFRNR